MTKPFSVCVFCSASRDLSPSFQNLAAEMGALAADQGWEIVYGGGSLGLMGILADSAMQHGTSVTGIIPAALAEKEVAHKSITNLEICEDMHTRQKRMMALANGFVVLPGGMGTMAELLEAITWKQLDLHDKPIAIINHEGYWDGLLEQFARAKMLKFMHGDSRNLFHVFKNLQDLPRFFS